MEVWSEFNEVYNAIFSGHLPVWVERGNVDAFQSYADLGFDCSQSGDGCLWSEIDANRLENLL